MGFTDAREPSKNAIFHGDGFLLYYVEVISVKVTYSPICKEMESSCNSSYNPNALYSMYERGEKVLIRKAAGQRFQLIIGYECSSNICSWKMPLT